MSETQSFRPCCGLIFSDGTIPQGNPMLCFWKRRLKKEACEAPTKSCAHTALLLLLLLLLLLQWFFLSLFNNGVYLQKANLAISS